MRRCAEESVNPLYLSLKFAGRTVKVFPAQPRFLFFSRSPIPVLHLLWLSGWTGTTRYTSIAGIQTAAVSAIPVCTAFPFQTKMPIQIRQHRQPGRLNKRTVFYVCFRDCDD